MRISDWSSDVCSSDLPALKHRTPPLLGQIRPEKTRPDHRPRAWITNRRGLSTCPEILAGLDQHAGEARVARQAASPRGADGTAAADDQVTWHHRPYLTSITAPAGHWGLFPLVPGPSGWRSPEAAPP